MNLCTSNSNKGNTAFVNGTNQNTLNYGNNNQQMPAQFNSMNTQQGQQQVQPQPQSQHQVHHQQQSGRTLDKTKQKDFLKSVADALENRRDLNPDSKSKIREWKNASFLQIDEYAGSDTKVYEACFKKLKGLVDVGILKEAIEEAKKSCSSLSSASSLSINHTNPQIHQIPLASTQQKPIIQPVQPATQPQPIVLSTPKPAPTLDITNKAQVKAVLANLVKLFDHSPKCGNPKCDRPGCIQFKEITTHYKEVKTSKDSNCKPNCVNCYLANEVLNFRKRKQIMAARMAALGVNIKQADQTHQTFDAAKELVAHVAKCTLPVDECAMRNYFGSCSAIKKILEHERKCNDENCICSLLPEDHRTKFIKPKQYAQQTAQQQTIKETDLNVSGDALKNSLTSSVRSDSVRNDLIKIPEALRINSSGCEVLNTIGGGRFSKVHKIKMKKRRNMSDDGIYGFKQFNLLHNSVKEEEKTMIQKEIELLSYLKHDNIVKIIGAIGDPDAVDTNNKNIGIGIFMEYCHNGSIRSLLDKNNSSSGNGLNMDLIIHLLFGAAQGLEYLHDHVPKHILHGDIKSDNILVDSEYNAKICDFGISKLIQTTSSASTIGGNIGGTYAYKSPEAFDNKLELKSDVYSFGCVILEILTGDRPWKGLSDCVIMRQVFFDKEQHDVSKVRNDTPEELIKLMRGCLDYKTDNRPTIKHARKKLGEMMKNAILIELDNQTEEYSKINSLFFQGDGKEGSLNKKAYKIVKIEIIKHLFAGRRYKTELSIIEDQVSRLEQTLSGSSSTSSDDEVSTNEKLLFHGTSYTNPMDVLNHPDAFMKDYSNDGFYGRGLYFAELARYSHSGYRYNIEGTNQYQLLVCSVICGKSFEFGEKINEGISQKDLGTEYHSVHGGPHRPSRAGPGDDDSSMYVVYKDTQVLAKYLITYERVLIAPKNG